jgi:hypothetical protein
MIMVAAVPVSDILYSISCQESRLLPDFLKFIISNFIVNTPISPFLSSSLRATAQPARGNPCTQAAAMDCRGRFAPSQ